MQQKYALAADTGAFGFDVNFQASDPGDGGLPSGYRIDVGQAFGHRGDGFWYGFGAATTQVYNRNSPVSRDERFDTQVFLASGATWEVAVPSGTYWVRGVFGDATPVANERNNVVIETLSFTDRDVFATPPAAGDWDEYFGQVTVTDGRLTISRGTGASDVKLSFLQVREATTPQYAVNFEGTGGAAHNNPLPDNYLIDAGAAFGDRAGGLRYGWVNEATGLAETNPNGRNRNAGASPDERYDTLNHFYNGGPRYVWEMKLSDGKYEVLAVFGESTGGTSTNEVWIENVRFYDPDPGLGNDWDLFMGMVIVSDGRLTIRMDPSVTGAKIAFLEVTAVPEPSAVVLFSLGLVGVVLAIWRGKRRG